MLNAWGMIEEFFPLFVFVLFCFVFFLGGGRITWFSGEMEGDQASP